MLAQKQSITWPSRIVVIALLAATLCAVAAWLQLPRLSFSHVNGATEISVFATLAYCVPALLLICIVALAALQINARLIAGVLATGVAALVCVTIVAWVLNFQPPVHVFLVNATATSLSEAQSWFPSGNAIRAASLLALLSITILLLALRVGAQVARPLAWAVAVLTLGAPLIGLFVAAIASISDAGPDARAPLTLARQAGSMGASPLSLFFILLTISCIGAALLANERAQPAARSEWGARVRALMVVAVLAFTLTLWHMVRGAEVRQLQNDVNAALQESIRDVRSGMGNTLNSINRLAVQLLNAQWKPTVTEFALDARGFFRDYEAALVVAITDPQGQILHAARRNPLISTASRTSKQEQLVIPIPPQEIGVSELGSLIANDRSVKTVAQAIASKEPIRGVAIRDEKSHKTDTTFFSAYPIFDADGISQGAIVVIYNARVGLHQMLANTAPEFFIHIVLDDVDVYDRPSADGALAAGTQFRLTNRQQGTLSAVTFDITPS
ncbi:MAG TPA: hypothetical protein VK629_18510, partial [Steroidobacteraceae bacterium]|nr:hypothetical protein [Steroidobacteraceae bacterium]